MKNNHISQNKTVENILCEAIECIEKATETLEVPAGDYGNLELYLCKECVQKFIGDKKNEK